MLRRRNGGTTLGVKGVVASGVGSLILMLTSLESRLRSSSSGATLAAPDNSSNGKLSHGPPRSLMSLASEALEDLRDEARLPRWTCRNADRRPCQPPGDEVWVVSSSTSSGSFSRSLFSLREENCIEIINYNVEFLLALHDFTMTNYWQSWGNLMVPKLCVAAPWGTVVWL